MKTINSRTSEYPVDDIFLKRYSPRAFSGEAISKEELMTIFEAARWAPSASNIQPWRFIYAMNGTPEFEKLMSVLVDFNKDWCKRASALILTISNKMSPKGDPSITHSFDTGSAWENLALQASTMNLIAHGMAGFDYAKAKTEFSIPDDYAVEMMIAVGKLGNIEDLSEHLKAGEKPNDRKPLEEIVFEGKFPS
jgi:nitroreductase